MTTPLQQAAQALIEQHLPTYLDQHIAELRKALDAELQHSVEPYAVFHGLVDSGEHGAFNLDLLKMIPRGAYLYLHPPQPQATTPALRECWYESNELKVCLKCGQMHDKAIAAQGEKP